MPTMPQGKKDICFPKSRMWFSLQQIETEALRKIIRSNRNRLEIEMADLLLDIMAKMEVETVSFCLHDIIPPCCCVRRSRRRSRR